MQGSRSVCVVDANVLIDLHRGSLLGQLFRLPYRLVTADVTTAELVEPSGAWLVELGLEEAGLSGEQVLEVARLRAQHGQVSTNDLFALVLARAMGATLLTGDRHLRRLAEQQGVAVHGTLWVLDEMVKLQIVGQSQAAQALEHMLAQGSRLPEAECQKRLRQWIRT